MGGKRPLFSKITKIAKTLNWQITKEQQAFTGTIYLTLYWDSIRYMDSLTKGEILQDTPDIPHECIAFRISDHGTIYDSMVDYISIDPTEGLNYDDAIKHLRNLTKENKKVIKKYVKK